MIVYAVKLEEPPLDSFRQRSKKPIRKKESKLASLDDENTAYELGENGFMSGS